MRVIVTPEKHTILPHGVSFHGMTEGWHYVQMQQAALRLFSLGVWNTMDFLLGTNAAAGVAASLQLPLATAPTDLQGPHHTYLRKEGRKEMFMKEPFAPEVTPFSVFVGWCLFEFTSMFSFPLNCPCIFKGCLLSVFWYHAVFKPRMFFMACLGKCTSCEVKVGNWEEHGITQSL